jgi:hypothetical protein
MSEIATTPRKINPKQAAFLENEKPPQGIMFGGRSSGKTYTLILRWVRMWRRFPKAKGFLAGNTFGQMQNIVLKDFRTVFETFGITEYSSSNPRGLYIIFKKPPEHFLKPYKGVEDYKYTVTFINGFTIQLLSFDNGGINRGGDYDFGDCDEIALFSDADNQQVLQPMLRANPNMYSDPLHHSFRGYTSIPREIEGEWIYRIEDIALNSNQRLASWVETTCIDNFMNLPKNYFAKMKLSMSPEEFDIEIKNKRPEKISNSYYPSFSTRKHTITPYDYDYDPEHGMHQTQLNTHNKGVKIKATWDFNGHFVSLIVSQRIGKYVTIFDEMWAKVAQHSTLVAQLAHDFCQKYQGQTEKVIIIAGDPSGRKKPESSKQSSYDQIEEIVKSYGWKVEMQVLSYYRSHQRRHRKINELLTETNPNLPIVLINAQTCPALIRSIRNTPMLPSWEKDKRSERAAIPQEYATHLSDCFDYNVFEYFEDNDNENDVEAWFG